MSVAQVVILVSAWQAQQSPNSLPVGALSKHWPHPQSHPVSAQNHPVGVAVARRL